MIRSISRTQHRELEKKVIPAIKSLSAYISNTTQTPDLLKGYRANAGEYTDSRGRSWQVQVHTICAKSDRMKRDEVQPIIAKNAIIFRTRVLIKTLLDSIFN